MEPVSVFSDLSSRLGLEVAELAGVELVLVDHLLVGDEVTDLGGLMVALIAIVPHAQVYGLHVSLQVRLLLELLPAMTANSLQIYPKFKKKSIPNFKK